MNSKQKRKIKRKDKFASIQHHFPSSKKEDELKDSHKAKKSEKRKGNHYKGNEGSRKKARVENKPKDKFSSEANAARSSEFSLEAKRLWTAILRFTNKEKEERSKKVDDLFDLLRPKVMQVTARRDLTRCLQCCFKYGTSEQKDSLFAGIEPKLLSLCKGPYSCHLVIALLRNGDAHHKQAIVKALRGNILRLGTHNCGSKVLAQLLDADLAQPAPLMEEFFGAEYMVFAKGLQNETGEGQTRKTWDGLSLKRALCKAPEVMQKKILLNVRRVAIKQAEKGLLRYPFAQRVMFEYVENASTEQVLEIAPLVREAMLAMVGTKNGAMAVARCVAICGAKERKKFLKAVKGRVMELALHEFAYIVLLALLNTVDDTVLVQKAISAELVQDGALEALATDDEGYGFKILLQIIAPRNKKYFTEIELETILPAENTSKKPVEVRKKELVAQIQKPLLAYVCANLDTGDNLLKKRKTAQIVFETAAATWDSDLLDAILDLSVVDESKVGQDGFLPMLESPFGHFVLKWLVQAEALELAQNKKEQETNFAKNLLDRHLDSLHVWININRPAFVFSALAAHPHTKLRLEEYIQKEDGLLDELRELSSGVPGVKALCNELSLENKSKAKKSKTLAKKPKTPVKGLTAKKKKTPGRKKKIDGVVREKEKEQPPAKRATRSRSRTNSDVTNITKASTEKNPLKVVKETPLKRMTRSRSRTNSDVAEASTKMKNQPKRKASIRKTSLKIVNEAEPLEETLTPPKPQRTTRSRSRSNSDVASQVSKSTKTKTKAKTTTKRSTRKRALDIIDETEPKSPPSTKTSTRRSTRSSARKR